jgi:hypothetical protein
VCESSGAQIAVFAGEVTLAPTSSTLGGDPIDSGGRACLDYTDPHSLQETS